MKKILTIVLCSALLVGVLTAAANSQEEKKVLRIGMSCNSAPYCWTQTTDEHGAVKVAYSDDEYAYGNDVIVAKKLAEALDMKLEIHKIEWEGLPPAIVSGKIDAAIAAMGITEKRKESVDFTIPYYYANIVALVRKDSPQASAQSIADLKGSSVTSQINTLWYDKADQIPEVKKLPPIDTIPAMIVALQSGKCDVLIVDIPTALSAAYVNPELMMVEFAEGKGFQTSSEDVELGIAVRKGNKELVEAMNSVLATMTDEDRAAIMDEAIRTQPISKL